MPESAKTSPYRTFVVAFADGRVITRTPENNPELFSGEQLPLAPVPGTKRKLLVWIWYAAAAGSSSATDAYLPAAWRRAVERQSGVLLNQFLTRDLISLPTPTGPFAVGRALYDSTDDGAVGRHRSRSGNGCATERHA